MDKLAGSSSFKVKQQVEMLEALTGFETNNKYDIKDSEGKKVYKAKEHSGVCSRMCLGSQRPFRIEIEEKDSDKIVMEVKRDYKYSCIGQCFSCCDCCKDCVTCEAPPGNVIGFVKQEYNACNANFSIRDANGDVMLLIEGPCFCGCRCPGQKYKFRLLSADGSQEVGKLYKEWGGLAKELFTDADNFKVEVANDTSVQVKSILVAAALLIDFMFFEDSGGHSSNRVGPGL
ncbi:hypothetical protein BOX15_Mlig010494g1 [Macrostomum lignano]|uniref:Phospholipid scramblase n=1 Tax=Macrostomum lignano TaxID=282301 RepID=A0A267DHC1_9PLAT|nr:hypothetical protein BOX15_Mlig010494g3 [Macrostomum lignano]PAA48034.1 hypothetical protein BOX15_Mlig010494g2 [Macrostomum lignano]PAA68887.1 hypothetical protein BOX15_Mlig010494g1 [Macrostomum lignano]